MKAKKKILDKFEEARAWCAQQFKKRFDGRSHPSFLAGVLLEEADKRFKLESFGVEGWSSDTGRTGVSYLNYGDGYIPTIYARSRPEGASFCYGRGGWAPLVGG